MAKLSASSGRKSSEQRRANGDESRGVRRPAFPKLNASGLLFSGSSATTTPTLTTATTSPGNFSPASFHSPLMMAMRPKTAGAEGDSAKSIGFKSQQQRQQWADMMMSGSPIEVVADDDTYIFPTPLRRPSTAANSPAMSSDPFAFLNGKGAVVEKGNMSPTLGTPMEDEEYDTTWPLKGHGMKPVRAHTTKDWTTDGGMEKPKLSRWKSLGGLFGKKKVENGVIDGLRSPTETKEEQSVTKTDPPAKEESPKEQTPTSPGGGLLRNFTKRNKNSEKRPKTRDGKADKAEQSAPNATSKAPLLDVEFPEITLERYSVMFQEIRALPARSTSLSSNLLARRQAMGERSNLVPGGSLKALDVSQRLGHVRSATEPSPRSPRTPGTISHRLIPEEEIDGRELPHISTLMNRPRPIKRTNTAPSAFSSVNPREQKLSPAFEADEMEYDDRDRQTPTPPEPSPPSTPKSLPKEAELPAKEVKPLAVPRQNSWEHSSDSNYEIITIGKRISENDILAAPTLIPAAVLAQPQRQPSRRAAITPKPPVALGRSNSNRPRLDTAVPPRLETSILPGLETVVPPRVEVAVARTLSLKRANSAKKTIVRAPSVKSPKNSASTPRITTTEPPSASASPVAPPAGTPVLHQAEQQPARPLLQSSYSIVNHAQPATLSRKESTRLEIKKEIWGERKVKVDVREAKGALMPQMCVVEEEESRRSVWGMIETA